MRQTTNRKTKKESETNALALLRCNSFARKAKEENKVEV